jgi:hypothetical protein
MRAAALLPTLNERPFQGRTESRKAKSGIDYHVEVDRRFYSVPHALVGQVLDPEEWSRSATARLHGAHRIPLAGESMRKCSAPLTDRDRYK